MNMRAKKIISISMLSLLIFSCVGCSSTDSKKVNETESSSNISNEPSKLPETSSEKPVENVTTEEPTTKEEKKVLVIKDFVNYNPELSYLLDYKDFLIANFDGKEFNCGEIYNCQEELTNLGYDFNEYGKVYSFVYSEINDKPEFKTKAIESTYDETTSLYLVDASHNFILENRTKESFRTNITFTDTTLELTFTFY